MLSIAALFIVALGFHGFLRLCTIPLFGLRQRDLSLDAVEKISLKRRSKGAHDGTDLVARNERERKGRFPTSSNAHEALPVSSRAIGSVASVFQSKKNKERSME